MFRNSIISGSLLLLSLLGSVQAAIVSIGTDVDFKFLKDHGGLTPKAAAEMTNKHIDTDTDSALIEFYARQHPHETKYVYLFQVEDPIFVAAWMGYLAKKHAAQTQGTEPPAGYTADQLANIAHLPIRSLQGYWKVQDGKATYNWNDDSFRVQKDHQLKALLDGAHTKTS
ncbi:uncharacterized protein PgNI_11607 [Pyricularia grisea]|uniref:Uncharacterized protein n=1 Tax=Pyricularia grisea TaxID=148305 RepID=A0A6P8AN39_PYRGI|nr:uncharacterized protein PgNI_11607 [Pyricularia grisea]TLD03440.1 hypothetical protein PgNI_11607 [Pyricularia grisea]